jgi:hypothetical protein
MRAAADVLGLLTALVCAGCGFKSTQTLDGPPPDDAAVDASGEDAQFDGGLDACVTFSRQLNTCGLSATSDLSITQAATYNTSTRELRVGGLMTGTSSAQVTVNGQTVVALLVRNLTITSGVRLRAEGNMAAGAPPLAIIASGNVTLEDGASIDVSDGGAGAVDVCSTQPTVGTNNSAGSGGGGGGAYGGGGGAGGAGNLGVEAAGGTGGGSVAMSTGLRGGCSGASGGVGSGNNFGASGRGGGAMLIIAASGITLGSNAVLQAGGGGGGGGTRTTNPDTGDGGGGGGGSGGLIRLEAPNILAMNARIVANGGGGGEGSSSTEAGNSGAPGLAGIGPAAGGVNGAIDGADGGQGGALASPAGSSPIGALGGGGGGGGGGVGYIHILSPAAQLGVNVSPAAVIEP